MAEQKIEPKLMKKGRFYFYERAAHGDCPSGLTVSKSPTLPDGDFRITEHIWPNVTLWFIADDNFTADEREEAKYYIRFRSGDK